MHLTLLHQLHEGNADDPFFCNSHSGFQSWAFAKLFPFDARWNSSTSTMPSALVWSTISHPSDSSAIVSTLSAVLATFYISSFPNFILAFVPANLDLSSLHNFIAFAIGGLLGDVFFHLIPHAFMGGASEDPSAAAAGLLDSQGVRVVLVEEKRNVIIGAAIFAGFFAFFFLDKTMRVLSATSNDGSSKGHSHHHHHSSPQLESSEKFEATSTAVEPALSSDGLRSRGKVQGESAVVAVDQTQKAANASLKLSAYLNLFGDFTHNITDGLIADYSILIKSGLTKRQAMASQFLTAVGAFVGTFLGIWIAESAGAGSSAIDKGIDLAAVVAGKGAGFLGTSVQPSDLVIPATAGVSVIPELLEESRSMKQAIKEYACMLFGVLVMAFLAWNE
ncbi:hypothetical protein QFC20_000938 [Naganishia adeliensis]|uniref:Uncharacterized protein n=1 Tax=Naganishia adeliensis TaxID=92952 RepID=A0ACC2WUY5_9TREE|nr:hypothetical protein QFC20_000938 [Naganishia adeliensis]